MPTIRFINNAGGGFNGTKEIADGVTVGDLFHREMPGADPKKFNIRVNNAAATTTQRLAEGDLVSIIPGKYDGGATRHRAAAPAAAAATAEPPATAEELREAIGFLRQLRDDPHLLANLRAAGGGPEVILAKGGGFGRKVGFTLGTTIGEFFEDQVGDAPSEYRIEVNTGTTEADYVLRDGDRILIARLDGEPIN